MKIHKKPKYKSAYFDPYPSSDEDPCNYLDTRNEITFLSGIRDLINTSVSKILLPKYVKIHLQTNRKLTSNTLLITDMMDGSKWLS